MYPPLRPQQQGSDSKISKNCLTPGEVERLLLTFAEQAQEQLLFLKNVAEIIIAVRNRPDPSEEGAQQLTILTRAHVANLSPELEEARLGFTRLIRGGRAGKCAYRLRITTHFHGTRCVLRQGPGTDPAPAKATSETHEWMVVGRVGDGAVELAQRLKSAQLAAVAVNLSRGKPLSREESRAFCFLPLPVATGLPFHVNGSFALTSNRRGLWAGDANSGEGTSRSCSVILSSLSFLVIVRGKRASCSRHQVCTLCCVHVLQR